ncbi:lycopene cyclase domain-containing protein [Lishizhenia tianjinensis]|uniref:Lycopene cyclase domain-containing protein n=1 Tax=Lishizhenia tianjinensis TaxID=477690 RepID=A0A1I7AZR5_9FLAO|nr:lycopene cyclase domain-containing protein [Lishizhenia tianjinensis]SFT80417.1 lycopene cyclase domain-containing protein [Lishizhenia tianjinensis]
MSLYLWINLLTLAGPFFLSFDKKVAFYKHWKALFPALLIVGTGFLVWDEFFTQNGIWGFNPEYLSGIYLGHLPLEEILFFFTVPYACIFIFACIEAYFPDMNPNLFAYIFSISYSFTALFLGFYHLENWYTSTALIGSGILNAVFYFAKTPSWYPKFSIAFMVAILPFLLVNGILTGLFTPAPVVWYNEVHIMGPRIGSIPAEDLFYNFFMLFGIMLIYMTLRKKTWANPLR